MNPPRFSRLLLAFAGSFLLTVSDWAGAEPPSRAARLGYISGNVIFSPAGEDDWRRASVNRPLTNGDRLWVDDGARAELQIGGAAIRLGGGTSLTLLNLDDRIAQVQLTEGTLNVRVRSLGRNQTFEVNTPNLAFSMNRAGQYRIDVNANDDATSVFVRSGRGDAYGERASYALNAGQGFRFYGSGLSDYDRVASRDDDLDRWATERERRYTNSAASRYVSYEVVGYEDLDAHGSWRRDPTYGNVWAPNRVAAGWTPYRDGHWAWIEPWGWTWVDDQPWGYAVSHYGRWANIGGRWSWVPGPRAQPAVYAPAQVAFVGGSGPAAATAGALAALIGWFPLAPREVYQPSYPVSRGYFERINRSNAAVAPTVINNYYNTTIVSNNTTVNRGPRQRQTYANQQVQGAVVAVPPQAFTQAQSVAKAAVPVSQQQAAAAQAAAAPAPTVKPDRQSVQGGAPVAERPRGRDRDRERRVVARTAPPAPAKAAPAAAAPAPAVVTAVQAPAPTATPPAAAPGRRSADERKADAAKGGDRRGDRGRNEAAKAEGGKAEAAKTDAGKGDPGKAESARGEAAKADAAKAEAAKVDASRAEAVKAEAAKAEAAKAEASRAEAAKAAAAKADAAKGDERKRDREKADAARGDERRKDRDKADAGKAEAAKADIAKAEAARAEAARAEAAKAESAKAAAAAAKADASRAEAAKAEAGKAAAAKAEASRAEAAKAEAGRAEAAKAAAAKADVARAEAAKADAVKNEAARAEALKAREAKNAASQGEREAAKAAREKARAAMTEAEKADDEKRKGDREPRNR